MSTPYSVAVSLVKGKADINSYSEELITDKEILSLVKKVDVKENTVLNDLVPHKRPAKLEIILNNNSRYFKRIDLAKGEPENPMSDRDIKDKFISLATFGGKTNQQALNLYNQVVASDWKLSEIFTNI